VEFHQHHYQLKIYQVFEVLLAGINKQNLGKDDELNVSIKNNLSESDLIIYLA
jgi:hypothetical protein